MTARAPSERCATVGAAAANGRSAEAEHLEILREALFAGEHDFASRARALRRRLRSTLDSTEVIRADRDRDTGRAAPRN